MKVLLDSNIVIYSLMPEHLNLRRTLKNYELQTSEITRVEVLGFSGLAQNQFEAYELLMADMRHHLVTRAIINCAVALRRQRKMSLGDALIAGTALENDLTLITRNTRDFQWISRLALINPFEENS